MINVAAEQTLQEQIIQKAWEDAEFKKQLLADPKAAVKEAFGIDIPDSIEVEVVEETANKYYFVLPQNPSDISNDGDSDGAAWQ
ncbi:NHLP leader peptide family RiPP precursor [Paenibacillus endophyticus]|uniref:NHLP leader peptide family RiPP precursor n=1 Tax=Paenibacillus endophyticus TaxID=1294268 RepID=UPI00161829DC|nr:NHLP leader peptide family RiPP precursor [Paenibacillus endophyticus]